jgi:hypothetical protein
MAHDVDRQIVGNPEAPRVIRMHADDNVAIVANDFGLPAGAQLPSGPALRELSEARRSDGDIVISFVSAPAGSRPGPAVGTPARPGSSPSP